MRLHPSMAAHVPRHTRASGRNAMEAEVKKISRLLASNVPRDDDELFETATQNMSAGGDAIRFEVLELLEEVALAAAVQRLAQVKKERMSKGLVMVFGAIARWAASQRTDLLEMLRRRNCIAALTHVISELAVAAGHMHDSIQLEDLQLASYEALGWLTGSESGNRAVGSDVIALQAPAAAKALEASLARFPENRRSKVLGLAALSWCLHQASASEAGSKAEHELDGASGPREESVKTILESLSESGNGDLQTLAMLSFGWVSFSHPPSGAALLRSHGLQMMVSAMQRHPLNRRLQYYACGTVSWIASQPSNRKIPVSRLVSDAGGVEAMVAASRLHIQDWNLQVACAMALCQLVAHGGPGMLQSLVTFGAIPSILDAVRHNKHYEKMQLAGVVTLKQFACFPWEIAHKHMAQCGAIGLVADFMSEALVAGDMKQADEMLDFFYILDASAGGSKMGGSDSACGCPVTLTHLFTDGAIVPMMRRLHAFSLPQERGAMERLRKFLEKLFQLNLGPVGWLSFDTSLIRSCLEQAVLDFLQQLDGKLSPQDSQLTVRLVVPVIAGMAQQSLQETGQLPEAVHTHSALLCAYAVAHPALCRADLRFLIEYGEGGALMTLEAKRAWLTCERQRLMRLGKAQVSIVTGRTGIMQDICKSLAPRADSATVSGAAGISVAFRDESAAGDGLRREWFQLVGTEFADPQVNLFCSYDGGRTLQPSPSSSLNDTHIAYFELIGKVVGLALLHGETVPLRFSTPFLKRILGHTLTPEDLTLVDPAAYKSIKYVIEAEEVEDLCLTFCEASDHPADVVMSADASAKMAEFELVPGGKDKEVTNENRHEYVRLKVEHKLGLLRCRAQVDAFLRGLHEPLPRDSMMRLSKIVSVAELDLLIAGLPSIDLDDWEAHTMYMGFFNKDSVEAKWFWKILREEFEPQQHAKLLHFVTGSSSVPGTGFSVLSGYGGGQCRFTIEGRVDQGPEHLPTAATCFNRLRMPRYGSQEEMSRRLRIAITGVQQFHEAAMGQPNVEADAAAARQIARAQQ